MIKTWPQTVREAVYADLRELWERREFPADWTLRWLAPIPKVPDPTLNDLRPLSLLEALRKTWCSIFVRRIQNFWRDSGCLHKSQHGGVKDRGTESAVLEMINTLETAHENRSTLALSSWDMKRAFDSVSRPLIRWSLSRLGIPEDLTDYLIRLESNGTTVLRSPKALEAQRRDGNLLALGFHAERGTGQGDFCSSPIWSATFDPLLCALDEDQNDPLWASGKDGNPFPIKSMGYADDLFTPKASPEALQRQADIVSAYRIVTNITLSVEKFRAFLVKWGNGFRTTESTVLIHTRGWTAIPMQLATQGTLKHLCVLWDMDLSNVTQYEHLVTYLRQSTAHLAARMASVETKLLTLNRCIIPKVLYPLKFMPWSIERYTEIQKTVDAAIKRITKNGRQFPTDLLYVKAGLGQADLTYLVQKAKMATATRLLMQPTSKHVVESLLTRAFRYAGQPTIPNVRHRLRELNWMGHTWYRSVIEWNALNDVQPELIGHSVDCAHLSPFDAIAAQGRSLAPHEVREIQELGIG
jgi:hypothetical protein